MVVLEGAALVCVGVGSVWRGAGREKANFDGGRACTRPAHVRLHSLTFSFGHPRLPHPALPADTRAPSGSTTPLVSPRRSSSPPGPLPSRARATHTRGKDTRISMAARLSPLQQTAECVFFYSFLARPSMPQACPRGTPRASLSVGWRAQRATSLSLSLFLTPHRLSLFTKKQARRPGRRAAAGRARRPGPEPGPVSCHGGVG